jgi:hypothetical protein
LDAPAADQHQGALAWGCAIFIVMENAPPQFCSIEPTNVNNLKIENQRQN